MSVLAIKKGIRRIFSPVILSVVFSGCFFPAVVQAQPGPDITVDKEVLDLGVVYSGGSAEGTFTISNQGDSMLIIKEVRTSCGCTS